jgi:phosphate transport system substrate-binding protein
VRGLIVVVAVLALLPPAATAQSPPTITMSGAVPAAALAADLAYFYRRAHERPPRFDIVGGTTVTGLSDVARGIIDLGLVTRPLVPGDPDGLVFRPVALSGVCLVSNRANPVPGLSRAQIGDLVAARVTSWAQVPGATRTDAVAAGGLAPGAGTRAVFEATFLDPLTPLAYVPRTFTSSAQVRDYVKATPNAWGYVDLAFTAGVHVIPYEGGVCSRSTVASGAYPARTQLGFVSRGEPKGRVARFLRWVRRSAKARRVIASRYVPLS